jgi:hypothetical protein
MAGSKKGLEAAGANSRRASAAKEVEGNAQVPPQAATQDAVSSSLLRRRLAYQSALIRWKVAEDEFELAR